MKKIMLDTNFLLIPATQKVDIFSEIGRLMDEPFSLYALEGTIIELEKIIKEGKGRHRDAAKLALLLLKKKGVSILGEKQKSLYIKTNSKDFTVDDILLKISDQDTLVATQDSLLRKRLAERGIRTIFLRSKKQLEIR